jgi:hypothetical protein
MKPKIDEPKQFAKYMNPQNQTTWSQNWWTYTKMHEAQNRTTQSQIPMNVDNLDFVECMNPHNWAI